MGSAKNTAYHDAADPKVKPIVFWGVWIWFGPTVFVSLLQIFVFLTSDYREGGIFALVIPILYLFLGGWALRAVTKGYFRKEADETETSED